MPAPAGGACLSLPSHGVGAALAPMLSGHAGTAPPTWLSKPAVFIDIAALVFWTGALLPLGWLLRSRDAAAPPALERFSRLIPLWPLPRSW